MALRFDAPVKLFSPEHLLCLGLAAICCTVTVVIGRRLDEVRRRRLMIILWAVFTAVELTKYLHFLIVPESFNPRTGLPFHLCSISLFIYPAAVFTRSETFRNFAYAVNMPGAFFALVTPDVGSEPMLSFYFLHLMVAHTFIVLLPLYMVCCGIFRPDIRSLPKVAGLLAVCLLPAAVLNRLLGSNYFFINGPVRGTLTQTFADRFGEEFYLLPMLSALLAAWGILYALAPVLCPPEISQNSPNN